MFHSAIAEYLGEHKLLQKLDSALNYCLESNCPYPEAFVSDYLLSFCPGDAEVRSIRLLPPATLQYDVLYKNRCRFFRKAVPPDSYALLFSALQARVASEYLARAAAASGPDAGAGEAPRGQSPQRAKSTSKQARPEAGKTKKAQAAEPAETPAGAVLSASLPYPLTPYLSGLPLPVFGGAFRVWPAVCACVRSLFQAAQDQRDPPTPPSPGSGSSSGSRPGSRTGSRAGSRPGSAAGAKEGPAGEPEISISDAELAGLQLLVFNHVLDIRCCLRGSSELLEIGSLLSPSPAQSLRLPLPLVPLFALEEAAEIGVTLAPGLQALTGDPARLPERGPPAGLEREPLACRVVHSFCRLVSGFSASASAAAVEQRGA